MPMTDCTIAEFQAALRDPRRYLADPRFHAGIAETGPYGLPRPRCGKFARVWRLAVGGRQHALRTFPSAPGERLGRLRLVQEHLVRVA